MKAKTIFLNEKEVTITTSDWHIDNYDKYMKKNYSNFNITQYVPLVLIEFNHCVIDLSQSYMLGVVYLPNCMSEFQKNYFKNESEKLKKYSLYLYGYSIERPIPIDELLEIIKSKPNKDYIKKEKRLS